MFVETSEHTPKAPRTIKDEFGDIFRICDMQNGVDAYLAPYEIMRAYDSPAPAGTCAENPRRLKA